MAGKNKKLKILHISPAYFSEESYIGGGERYPVELAKAMSENKEYEIRFVTFGKKSKVIKNNLLEIKIYKTLWHSKDWSNSISFFFLKDIWHSDIIHIHQYHTLISNLAILVGFIMRKKIFSTDYGGGGFNFLFLPFHLLVNNFLCLTEFNKRIRPTNKCYKKIKIIYGGINNKDFRPLSLEEKRQILFVGRIMPHKGINYLIEAMDNKEKLVIIGRNYNSEYFNYLKKIAKGKNVIFKTNVEDDELIKEYNKSLVTVLPSVYKDIYGNFSKAPELLGLTLLESMACATPVICTNVGGMPYIVENGKTGFVVEPNNSRKLWEKISYFINNPEKSKLMGQKARELVEKRFTWKKIAGECLYYYDKN